ncbi:MAG: hypothetical protein AAF211_24040, partial [Myxococcota bacterium]
MTVLALLTLSCRQPPVVVDGCGTPVEPAPLTVRTSSMMSAGPFHATRLSRGTSDGGLDVALALLGDERDVSADVVVGYVTEDGGWTERLLTLDEQSRGSATFTTRLDSDERLRLSLRDLDSDAPWMEHRCHAVPVGSVVDPGDTLHLAVQPSPPPVEWWLSTGDEALQLASMPDLPLLADHPSVPQIVVDRSQRFQTIEGFGAAMTESSAFLIDQAEDPDAVMAALFGREQGGLGLSFVRVPLGASDFALDWYTYDDAGSPEQSAFSIEREATSVLPRLRQALELNPELTVMGTPWSPPGWMKVGSSGPGGLVGGRLDPARRVDFADYLTKTASAFRDAGVPLGYVSLQNEPLFDQAPYPCSFMSASEQAEIIELLAPRFAAAGVATRILLYDHNWTNPDVDVETW